MPGLDFKSSVERVTAFQAGSIPVPRRHTQIESDPEWIDPRGDIVAKPIRLGVLAQRARRSGAARPNR